MQVRIVKDINDREEIRYKFALGAGMASIAMSPILSILVVFAVEKGPDVN